MGRASIGRPRQENDHRPPLSLSKPASCGLGLQSRRVDPSENKASGLNHDARAVFMLGRFAGADESAHELAIHLCAKRFDIDALIEQKR